MEKDENSKNPNEIKDRAMISQDNNLKSDSNSNRTTEASISDKNYCNSLPEMKQYLVRNYPKFFEHFELINFLSHGGTGKVFEGHLTKVKNKQSMAFKFKINRDKKNR
jgi:hypothetical protein